MNTTLHNDVVSPEWPSTHTLDTQAGGLLFIATQPLTPAWPMAIAELTGEHYAVTHVEAYGAASAPLGRGAPWILLGVCSDLNDGLRLLQKLWATGERALVFLVTTQDGAEAGAALLSAGADFWLPSSAGPELIASCIVAARRRRESQRDVSVWRQGAADDVEGAPARSPHSEFALDPRRMTLRIGRHLARLSAAEFRICAYLVRHRERWVQDTELRRAVFRPHAIGSESLVRVHVHKIRKALGNHHQCVQSKRHMGYRFVPLTAQPGQPTL